SSYWFQDSMQRYELKFDSKFTNVGNREIRTRLHLDEPLCQLGYVLRGQRGIRIANERSNIVADRTHSRVLVVNNEHPVILHHQIARMVVAMRKHSRT